MTQQPSVAIILVNWNGYEDTKKCLQSLRKVSYTNFKVILVDNGSSDGSGSRLESEHNEIVYIANSENLGFSGGNNKGIEYALEHNFDCVMLLNNDTTVERDFLDGLVKSLAVDECLGAVQPKILYMTRKGTIWNAGGKLIGFLGLTKTIGENKPDSLRYSIPAKVDWITGCGFMVKSSVLRKVGGLNDAFFMYYEDVDLSLRIRQAGFDLLYEPSSVIYHKAGASSNDEVKGKEGFLNPMVHFYNIRNSIWCVRNYTPRFYFLPVVLFQTAKLGAYVSYFLARGRFQKLGMVVKGVKEGVFSPVPRHSLLTGFNQKPE